MGSGRYGQRLGAGRRVHGDYQMEITLEPDAQVLAQADSWSAEEALRWAFTFFAKNDVAIASAFGPEGIAMIDLAAKISGDLKVFTLDTGFLFPETEHLIASVEKRYGITVERIVPSLTTKQQKAIHGHALWSRNPDLCCHIRKVEPLRRKLEGMRAWVTAIRRGQTASRATARKLQWDENFGCWKINPLADWTDTMVWDYIRRNHLAYNPLHDRHYTSIGCTHCTRAVRAGEDARAGRWSGFNKTECGLHDRNPEAPQPSPRSLSASASRP
jgi:phosphoadenosine phosphosulfate reductase